MAELQRETDLAVDRSVRRRGCPITGTSIWEAYEAERPCLQPLPLVLPEPFDLVGKRRVAIDSTISFKRRSYSIPFRYADQVVEVRGCARSVHVWAEGEVIALHPRHTRSRLLPDPAHYDGPRTDRVLARTPLGRMGRKLQEPWALAPERRSIAQYAAQAEVAR